MKAIQGIFVALALAAVILLSACVGVTTPSSAGGATSTESQMADWPNKWTGIIAVRESAEVWRLYAQAGSRANLQFAQALVAGLRNGDVLPASGVFALASVVNQRIAGPILDVEMGPGTEFRRGEMYVDGPAEWFAPGRAICVEVPASWQLVATQRIYPVQLGPRWNCIDFGPESATRSFADSNDNAAAIIVVAPAGLG